MSAQKNPPWIKKQTFAKGFEVRQARQRHDIGDFKMEPTGYYILIRLLLESKQIGLAVCNKSHEILEEFRGRTAKDIYGAIFEFEEKNNLSWFTSKEHIAYIGKELAKAQRAMEKDEGYIQE
ncbi:DUF4346 domain-containing protein [Candidatus Woesearchaeota archaeon]|nr:DUF4346 domain-containing protein [Candidatus Woesearchaeota archaeon]